MTQQKQAAKSGTTKRMPTDADAVRDFLRERGAGEHVIAGGLAGLLSSWEQTVAAVEEGYQLTLDDYLNELDVRQMLAEALVVAVPVQTDEFTERLQQADDQFRNLTMTSATCLWGNEVAEEEGWTAKQNWWYFRRPRQGDADFLAELDEVTDAD